MASSGTSACLSIFLLMLLLLLAPNTPQIISLFFGRFFEGNSTFSAGLLNTKSISHNLHARNCAARDLILDHSSSSSSSSNQTELKCSLFMETLILSWLLYLSTYLSVCPSIYPSGGIRWQVIVGIEGGVGGALCLAQKN